MKTSLFMLLCLSVFFAGCSSSQALDFTVLAESTSFQLADSYGGNLPPLIIIASTDKITLPVPGAEFPPALLEQLQQVDFSQAFVVFHAVGQLRDNGKITRIVRAGNQVHIFVNQFSVGPGNYELPGLSTPYIITLVTKGKQDWGGEFTFTVEVDGGELVYGPLQKIILR